MYILFIHSIVSSLLPVQSRSSLVLLLHLNDLVFFFWFVLKNSSARSFLDIYNDDQHPHWRGFQDAQKDLIIK